ncbi:MAG TPA: hypothetical protein VHD56_02730 [Tepidisphaeraceae bacterium]|nr:hypothetical protein [Tepidisphaeraceae bacterium]
MLQVAFTVLITLQFLLIIFHDMIDIPGWTHGRQVKETIGRMKFWAATGINAIFPGVAVGFAIWFFGRPKPGFVTQYWVIYCAITLGSAIMMWWIPYFFGASEKTKQEYARMYAGTKQVLPLRGDNPRPNLLHLFFHALFVVNLVLALALRFAA